MTVLFYTHSGSGGKDRGEEISHLILRDTLGRKEQGEKKCIWNRSKMCLGSNFLCFGVTICYLQQGEVEWVGMEKE